MKKFKATISDSSKSLALALVVAAFIAVAVLGALIPYITGIAMPSNSLAVVFALFILAAIIAGVPYLWNLTADLLEEAKNEHE